MLVAVRLRMVVLWAVLGCGCLGMGDDFGGDDDDDDDVATFDCTSIPPGPFEAKLLTGPRVYEDLAFDAEGNLVGEQGDAIFKNPYDGEPQVFVAGVPTMYGLRYLPDGDLVVAVGHEGSIERIDTAGVRYTLREGLTFPNGVAIDMNGLAYITDFSGQLVFRIDPVTGESTDLLTTIPNPNGITFDRWYKNLFIAGWAEKIIYKVPIFPNGEMGVPEAWDSEAPEGLLHGFGMDVCGNLYVTDILGGGTILYRIPAEGGPRELLWDSRVSGNGANLSNLEWGSGIGGWDENSIYLPIGQGGGVYELPVGVPSRPRPYPPPPSE